MSSELISLLREWKASPKSAAVLSAAQRRWKEPALILDFSSGQIQSCERATLHGICQEAASKNEKPLSAKAPRGYLWALAMLDDAMVLAQVRIQELS